MKRYAVLAAMVGAAVVFSSQPAKAYDYFIQLGVGASFIDDAKTGPFVLDTDLGTFSGQERIKWNPSLALSTEFGVQGPISDYLRFGLSWDYINARFDEAGFEGTLDGDPFSVTYVERDQLEAIGVDADNDAHILMYHMYWEPMGYNQFGGNEGQIKPFIGGGVGVAFLEDADEALALAVTAGARYFISDAMSVGIRYRLTWVDDFEDDFEIPYNDFFTHTVSATLGFHF